MRDGTWVAFPRLARYFGGHNRSASTMAMTAPVVQEQDPRTRRYVVGFVMPADVSAAGAPRFARFDPPWTPWFRRRNEVVVPVLGTDRHDDGGTSIGVA